MLQNFKVTREVKPKKRSRRTRSSANFAYKKTHVHNNGFKLHSRAIKRILTVNRIQIYLLVESEISMSAIFLFVHTATDTLLPFRTSP